MHINHNQGRLSELSVLVIQPPSHRNFKYFLFSASIAFCFFALLLHAAPLESDKSITVVNQRAEDPLWKKRWDEARNLAQQQQFKEAISKYHEVLQEKPLIEEVKWELCKSYIAVEEYERALAILESLVESAPEKLEYLVSGGEVAQALGKADLSSKFFGRALALDPGGPLSEIALLGLIDSFTELGKKELTIPLLEQLYQRGVLESQQILELARHYSGQKNFDRAAHYYLELINNEKVEPTVRVEAAATFDKSGATEEAAVQRELYLQSNSEDTGERVKLADFYYEQGEMRKALPHMLELLDKEIRRKDYMLAVARIYLFSLGRTDRALHYFQQYRKEFPDGADVSSEISTLELILANDLLAIVENDGVWMLWRDLARVTPDRIGIYRAMADMLEEMGRGKERDLIEVLQIINSHEPKEFEIVAKISKLYMKNNLYGDCLSFLNRIEEHHLKNGNFFILRAQCEDGSGLDLERLRSFGDYLKIKPSDQSILREAIYLTGKLGLVDEMRSFYESAKKDATLQALEPKETFFFGLLDNELIDEAHEFYQAMADQDIEPKVLSRMSRELSSAYLKSNRPFVSEQILREFAVRHPLNADGYLLLAGYQILREDPLQAEVWLGALERKVQTATVKLDLSQKSVLFYLNLLQNKLLGGLDSYQKALSHLNTQLRSNRVVAEDVAILLFITDHYLQNNQYRDCLSLIKRFRPKFKGVEELESRYLIAARETKNHPALFDSGALAELSYREGFALSEALIRLQRFEEAQLISEALTAQLPQSIRAKTLLAQSAKSAGENLLALNIYQTLADSFGAEAHFRDQALRLESMLGEPQSIFSIFSVATDETGRKNGINQTIDSMDYPEAKLMWARALWSADKWEESLDVYGLLDTELRRNIDKLIDLLQRSPELSSRALHYLAENDILDLTEQELVDLLMSIDFVAANLELDINQISTEYYNHYRWSKIVDKEMTAKSSLRAREFYKAEIDYKKLLEEDDELTEPIYPDLATVYGRLGRHKQETELLETIQEKSIFYPDLSQATEKSIRRRQPNLSFDGMYKREEGRDGFKNITQKYLGGGLEIKPTLSQEAGVQFGRNEYGNSFASTLAKSNYLLGNYAIQFGDTTEGSVKLGFEDFETDGDSFLIYDLKLKGSLEQRVDLFGAIRQQPVDDTIDSLENNIYRQDVQIGLDLDYLFGMFFGFDLSFFDYNDGNEGERYYLWGGYRWFGDRSSVDLTYSYLKLQNEIDNQSAAAADNGDDSRGLSYWSPSDYWKHRLAALYKLELWPTGRLQSGTSSFSAMYAIGYETNDVLVNEFEANILLEIAQPFLVKGTFSTVISDDYDNLKGYISLIYRW